MRGLVVGLSVALWMLACTLSASAQCVRVEAEVAADLIRRENLTYNQTDGQGGQYVRQLGATAMHPSDYSRRSL